MTRKIRALLHIAFFLSGAVSLVFEIYWTRELTHVFGSSTLAISTVLATFMGGLGLGCWLSSRFVHRVPRPLEAYGVVEGVIGAYALLVPFILHGYPALSRGLYHLLGDHLMLLSLGRFAVTLLLLGLPTTLMGTTLPLLARSVLEHEDGESRPGYRLGMLYATNTAGALVGAFCAGFVLLPHFGGRATNLAAAMVNLALCASVMFAARRSKGSFVPARTLEHPLGSSGASLSPAARLTVLLSFALSGAAAMVLEILWSRAVALLIGSSVYSFTMILMVFLGGLALGSGIFALRAERTRDAGRTLATVHLATAVAVLATSFAIDRMPSVYVQMVRWFGFGVNLTLVLQMMLAIIVILPVTILMGGALPLTMRCYVGGGNGAGRAVAIAYGTNTAGAILGSLVGGFLVLPQLGVQRGIFMMAFIYAALAVALYELASGLARSRRVIASICAPVGVAALILVSPPWRLAVMQSGIFRPDNAQQRAAAHLRVEDADVVYYRDGVSSTVSVERFPDGDGTFGYTLRNNGKPDASTAGDMPTQIMLGLVPSLFVRTPQPTVAVIGYGSGSTVGTVTQTAARRIDVVELEPAVIEATRFFDDNNHQPLRDPRVVLHIGDGRNFLFQKDDRYDLIISEPPNPWVAGVSNLFTREFWHLAHARLASGGIFCQWIQLYELVPERVKMLLNTFSSEFPYTYVFLVDRDSEDAILIASDHPIDLDVDEVDQRLRSSRLGNEADRIGVRDATDIFVRLVLGAGEIQQFAAGAPVNTDDNMLLEYTAPHDLIATARRGAPRILDTITNSDWPFGRMETWVKGTNEPAILGRLAEAMLRNGSLEQALRLIERSGQQKGNAYELAALLQAEVRRPPALSVDVGDGAKLSARDVAILEINKAEAFLEAGANKQAFMLLRRGVPFRLAAKDPALAVHCAYVALKAGSPGTAIKVLSDLESREGDLNRLPEATLLLGRAYFAIGNFTRGVELLKRHLATRMLARG